MNSAAIWAISVCKRNAPRQFLKNANILPGHSRVPDQINGAGETGDAVPDDIRSFISPAGVTKVLLKIGSRMSRLMLKKEEKPLFAIAWPEHRLFVHAIYIVAEMHYPIRRRPAGQIDPDHRDRVRQTNVIGSPSAIFCMIVA